jgi:hypothetical protein
MAVTQERELGGRPPGPGGPEKKGWFDRFLRLVEWLGNLLPHPVTLFAIFALMVVVISGIAEYFEVSVADPRPEGARGRSPEGGPPAPGPAPPRPPAAAAGGGGGARPAGLGSRAWVPLPLSGSPSRRPPRSGPAPGAGPLPRHRAPSCSPR